jgi:hypothetical protein
MNNPNQDELLALLKLLEQYNAGVVNSGRSGGSDASSSSSGSSSTRTPSQGEISRGLGMTATMSGLAGNLAQDQNLGQFAGILGLASAVSRPNASIQSVAPSVLGLAGLGQLGSLASMANNGITMSNTLGLLASVVNPAFGIVGAFNNLLGNPLGGAAESLGNTLGNPGSMNSLSNAGVSYAEQLGNSLNQSQIGMDTEAMDSLTASLSGSDFDSGDDSSSSSNDSSDSDSSSSSSSSDSSSSSSSDSDSDSRNSASD